MTIALFSVPRARRSAQFRAVRGCRLPRLNCQTSFRKHDCCAQVALPYCSMSAECSNPLIRGRSPRQQNLPSSLLSLPGRPPTCRVLSFWAASKDWRGASSEFGRCWELVWVPSPLRYSSIQIDPSVRMHVPALCSSIRSNLCAPQCRLDRSREKTGFRGPIFRTIGPSCKIERAGWTDHAIPGRSCYSVRFPRCSVRRRAARRTGGTRLRLSINSARSNARSANHAGSAMAGPSAQDHTCTAS